MKKKMSENMNDTEIEYVSVEDPLKVHRSAVNGTTLVSEIPNIIHKKNVIFVTGQDKKQFQLQVINFVKSKHFFFFFLRVNLAIMLHEIFQ